MFRSIDKWLPGYLASVLRRRRWDGTRRLIFCVADHFEPFRGGGVTPGVARGAVIDWCRRYGEATAGFTDADGRSPQHTCFYPEEEYDPVCLDTLAAFCRGGHGEVEIHLHHRHDTAEGLREKLVAFRDKLRGRHGLLGEGGRLQTVDHRPETLDHRPETVGPSCHPERSEGSPTSDFRLPISDTPAYGFVHGNWALCNARPDGDWCGVNEELGILAETGCYADFTFPSAPSPTQPRMVNSIYIARDRPGRPRGADHGERLQAGDLRPETLDHGPQTGDHRPETLDPFCHPERSEGSPPPATRHLNPGLLIIQGPLGLNWRRRKWGMVPRLENAELSGANPPTPERADLWARQCIHVAGRPDWVFVKVHTHGLVPANARVLLGEDMRRLHAHLGAEYNDGVQWTLHYVAAREMFNLVAAAAAGAGGAPGPWRDWAVAPPPG